MMKLSINLVDWYLKVSVGTKKNSTKNAYRRIIEIFDFIKIFRKCIH